MRVKFKKGLITPLLLLGVILALAGLAYWDEKKTASDKLAEESKGKLFTFDPGAITKIEITNVTADPKSFVLTKDEESKTWNVIVPIQYPADGEGLERLLGILKETKSDKEFELGTKTLADYGLDPAQITYRLSTKDGEIAELEIGGKTPTGFASYAKVKGDDSIHLVSQHIFTASNKTLSDVRTRKLFIPPAGDVEQIELSFPSQARIVLSKSGSNWSLIEPYKAEGDGAEINKWLSSLENLRVAEFIDSPGKELRSALTTLGKGTEEKARLRLQTKNGPKDLVFVENNNTLYTQINDVTFAEIDKSLFDNLVKVPKDFEDRSVFQFATTDVERVWIDGTEYSRKDADWQKTSDKSAAPFVQSMLVSLEFAKADDKLTKTEGERLAKGPAIHSVEIEEKGKPKISFSLWKNPDQNELYVLKLADSYYQVTEEFINVLKPKTEGSLALPHDHSHGRETPH